MRVVLTYPAEPGQPQYRALFSDWNLAPEVQDSMFAFSAPSDARRIAFLAEMPRAERVGAKVGVAAPAKKSSDVPASDHIGRTKVISNARY